MEAFLDSLGLKLTTHQDETFLGWFKRTLLGKECEVRVLKRTTIAKIVGVVEYSDRSGFITELYFDNAIRQIDMATFIDALSKGDIIVL